MRDPASARTDLDLVVVGGCGHVGLPLALVFADAGCRVGIYDVDRVKLDLVRSGQMPFLEQGAPEMLARVLAAGRLEFSADVGLLARTEVVVMVIGTPIDEFMNPSTRIFELVVDQIAPCIRQDSLLVLRSTVFPGTTDYVQGRLAQLGVKVEVAFCPERVAEGHALEEIRSLPQIIGANEDGAYERAAGLFARLDVKVLRTTPKEAELAKLLTNTWRYMRFAIANQFFQIAHRAGIDYTRVLHAIKHEYPRAADLPAPGFAAGPCLLKDTMQLAAFAPDHFPMGHSAMLVNEGLPGYVIDQLDSRSPLSGRTVGILGMAFKGDSDDPRTSLSYKLRKLAAFKGARVLCTDPYVKDGSLVPLETVLAEADTLILAAPHRAYSGLTINSAVLVDIWNLTGSGIQL
ncbi:MAG TPA: nucleotide sugar dehydrogenase [Candidatus Dormibacteraeota bacterium]|nr:nucleotide sugar dehydrogenase [Candidatus Dormibacteraeota bacterium]